MQVLDECLIDAVAVRRVVDGDHRGARTSIACEVVPNEIPHFLGARGVADTLGAGHEVVLHLAVLTQRLETGSVELQALLARHQPTTRLSLIVWPGDQPVNGFRHPPAEAPTTPYRTPRAVN